MKQFILWVTLFNSFTVELQTMSFYNLNVFVIPKKKLFIYLFFKKFI